MDKITSAENIIRRALEQYPGRVALASGPGIEDRVIADMLVRLDPAARVFAPDAWICGLRREHSVTSADPQPAGSDGANGPVKICPLFDWTETDLRDYIRNRNVPLNTPHNTPHDTPHDTPSDKERGTHLRPSSPPPHDDPAPTAPKRENDLLTATEKEILRGIVLGYRAKEIAAQRHVSEQTVTTHRKNIYRKLEVNNSQEAARYALRAGIMDASDYSI